MNNKRIVILTGKVGQGHLAVASALDYWARKFGYNSVVVDLIPAGSDRIYQGMVKIPQIHAAFYRSFNNLKTSGLILKNLQKDFDRKLKRYLPFSNQADVVISTHPFIHPATRKNKIMVILDPTVHAAYCSEPFADYYFTLWRESLSYLRKFRIENNKIIQAHPLARESFYRIGKTINSHEDKTKYKEQLNLNPGIPLGLIIAGGEWIERIKPYLKDLSSSFPPGTINLAFICGKKKTFAKRMQKKYPQNNFIFLDWLDERQMANWMGAADFSIALTLAQMSVEAGLCRVPIYIFGLIEGQEEGYRKVIEHRRVGASIHGNPEKQVTILRKWLPNNQKSFNKSLTVWQKQLLSGPDIYHQFLKKVTNSENSQPPPPPPLNFWQRLILKHNQ